MRLELVTDGAQQVVPVGHVAIGLHPEGRLSVDDAHNAAATRGHRATTMSNRIGRGAVDRADLTSGTALTGLRMLAGNPSRKKITKQCPAAMASALRVASSTNSGSLPVRRTNRGPEA